MKKILFTLVMVLAIHNSVFAGSRNMVEEKGILKKAGEAVSANLIIEPNNEVATGAYVEIEFENAVVLSESVINGTGKSDDIGFKGRGVSYQYSGYKNYKWNGKDGFYDAMSAGPVSRVPYKITRIDDYNIRVSLCGIPDTYANKSLADFNNSKEEPYYEIPLPVYVKEDGPIRLKMTGAINDKSLSYGNYIFNQSKNITTEVTTEVTTEEKKDISSAERYSNNKVEVSVGRSIMVVNGKEQIIDDKPYIQAGTGSVLIPLRAVSIALADGYRGNGSDNIVAWDADTKTAIISYNGKVINFTAGSNIMSESGKERIIPNGVIPEIKNGRMFVPFRVLGEALGAEVNWIAESKTACFN